MAGLDIGKFVIPNPFGPFEQERYCTYLVRSWLDGQTPEVRTPDYVRDNIPVDALAAAYATFATDLSSGNRLAPSGYLGTQGDFTRLFASEIGKRMQIATPYTLAEQTDFSEPMVRVNTDPALPNWDEARFWDALAEDYSRRLEKRGD